MRDATIRGTVELVGTVRVHGEREELPRALLSLDLSNIRRMAAFAGHEVEAVVRSVGPGGGDLSDAARGAPGVATWTLDAEQRTFLEALLRREVAHAADHVVRDPTVVGNPQAEAVWTHRMHLAGALLEIVRNAPLTFQAHEPVDPPEATLLGEVEANHGVRFVRTIAIDCVGAPGASS